MINYFNFKKLGNQYLITNDIGKFMFLNKEELDLLIHDGVDYSSELGKELINNYFCYDGSVLAFSDALKSYYRDMKNYLFSATSLHLFVLTNICNADCIYCQAHVSENENHGKMTIDIAKQAVDIALSSPERYLTFEFQGGEPLLNYDVLRFIVEYSADKAKEANKFIEYNLVSNLTLINDDIARFLSDHSIKISTSIDGHAGIHDINRPLKTQIGSYESVKEGIEVLEKHGLKYGAIQTTTRFSFSNARKIVDEYLNEGLDCVFIRSLTPLGCAKTQWDNIGYTSEEFLAFYEECLDYLLELNKKGKYIKENYASVLLTKILKGYSQNYMELRSPCGAGIGQIAYNHDGSIYTCDEGRMLAEMGDDSFKLGTVENTYDELINNAVCKSVCVSSVIESIPACSDCVYNPFCCKCPVINYSSNKSLYSRDASDYKCRINRGILDLIFERLQKQENIPIFESWVN